MKEETKNEKVLLNEQEPYWNDEDKIRVVLSEDNVRFIASLLREDDKNEVTSEWRENNKKDLRFLLYLDREKFLGEFAVEMGKKGGKSRAKKYSKKQLAEWGKMGGRPKKKQ